MQLRYTKATQSVLWPFIYPFKLRDLKLKFRSTTGICKFMKQIFRVINYEAITQVSQLQEDNITAALQLALILTFMIITFIPFFMVLHPVH